jgi:hypothetical protein
MVSVDGSEMIWHNDGHHISLRINKSEVEITEIFCPNTLNSDCKHEHFGCVVDYFIDRFGLECNVGVCQAKSDLQICWSLVGDPYDLEACQLWFVPVEDEVFYAWLTTKTG